MRKCEAVGWGPGLRKTVSPSLVLLQGIYLSTCLRVDTRPMRQEQRGTHGYWGLGWRVIWGDICGGYLGVMGEETAAREVVGCGADE